MTETAGGSALEGADGTNSFKAPASKSVQDILSTDADDESLRVYKQKLLGEAGAVVDASNPKNVLVRSLTLVVAERADVTIDLGADVAKLEKATFVIKREIVSGMKYVQRVSRMNVPVDKDEFMVGSYGPKSDVQSFTTPPDDAPSGMMHRGTYKVKSCFTDDDKNEWLSWSWTLDIKKDWE